jgi:hypothetical protein
MLLSNHSHFDNVDDTAYTNYWDLYFMDKLLRTEFNHYVKDNDCGFLKYYANKLIEKSDTFEYSPPPELEEALNRFESCHVFLAMIYRYENMTFDICKYTAPENPQYEDDKSWKNLDIEYISSYYFLLFLQESNNGNFNQAVSIYQKIKIWKNISQIRCPSDLSFKKNIYYQITQMQLYLLRFIKSKMEMFSITDINIQTELNAIEREIHLINRISKRKLIYLILIRYCKQKSFSEIISADERMISLIFFSQGIRLGSLSWRPGITFEELRYNEWLESGLLELKILEKNPVLNKWSKILTTNALLTALDTPDETPLKFTSESHLYEGYWQYVMACEHLDDMLQQIKDNLNTIL